MTTQTPADCESVPFIHQQDLNERNICFVSVIHHAPLTTAVVTIRLMQLSGRKKQTQKKLKYLSLFLLPDHYN